jgi:glucosamine-6-phosphate deaminase
LSVDRRVAADEREVAAIGADIVVEVVSAKPDAALICATGRSPVGLYRELAARARRGEVALDRVRIFQLDEYVGVGEDDSRSLYRWLERDLLDRAGIAHEQVVRLHGDASDLEAVCAGYEDAVAAAGGIDLAILGLGPNGHVGFNEPPSKADAPTRVVELTPASIESNARYWPSGTEVPTRALTAGMTVLLAARRVLLVVVGEHKRAILRAATAGPKTPAVPASLLADASGVTILCDAAAAG